MKSFVAVGILILILEFVSAPTTFAGPNIPGLGLCDYPGVGGTAQVQVIFGGQGYYCDFPLEENGSVWRCLEGSGGLGLSGGGFEGGGFGVPAPLIGGGGGACNFVCPDTEFPGLVAHQPNPPGAWKNFLKPEKCKPVEPVRNMMEPIGPPGPGTDEPPNNSLPPAMLGPVTNPGTPNPLTTENPPT